MTLNHTICTGRDRPPSPYCCLGLDASFTIFIRAQQCQHTVNQCHNHQCCGNIVATPCQPWHQGASWGSSPTPNSLKANVCLDAASLRLMIGGSQADRQLHHTTPHHSPQSFAVWQYPGPNPFIKPQHPSSVLVQAAQPVQSGSSHPTALLSLHPPPPHHTCSYLCLLATLGCASCCSRSDLLRG